MKEMSDAQFNQTKVMAQVFAKEYIENRILLGGLVALDNAYNLEYWPDDFEYEIDADIACMNAVANLNWNFIEEVAKTKDVFYIKYFNANLYHSGNYNDSFTDPMNDLGMTAYQANAIKDIIKDEMFYGLENSIYNNKEITLEITNWLYDKSISEDRLMNDINDIIE